MFYLHHWFRSFLPLHNPIGFGAVDFFALFIAALLVALSLAWPRIRRPAQSLAHRPVWCMAALALLPIALRLALLRVHPIPEPAVADDFSYVLLADTLRHFRLANPPHPFSQFFETFFVIQHPSYSSIYPLGQGIALALGWMIFGHPWAGVALPIGIFCALTYWMLRGWTTPEWALLGGVLATIEFGPLSQWMNSYWGGGVSAVAGCLVFGALPRLRDHRRVRDAGLLGIGLGIQLLTRPYESIFLDCGVMLFLIVEGRRVASLVLVSVIAFLPAVGLMLLHNKSVTGAWTTIPYRLSQGQYGIPATFTFQPNPAPHNALTREQQLDYETHVRVHGAGTDTPATYLTRLASRVRYYRFFFLAPLYFALIAFALTLRDRRSFWIAIAFALFGLGANFYPYFYSHYLAALTSLFILAGIIGLQRIGPVAAQWIVIVCVAQFLVWYGAHLTGDPSAWRYESWDAINFGDPDGRLEVNRELASAPGKQLVFVRYGALHTFKEWVYNAADIDGARIVWARDLGPSENEKLIHYYSDRTAWLLEPDAHPVHLQQYLPSPSPPPAPAPNVSHPHLKFEEVH